MKRRIFVGSFTLALAAAAGWAPLHAQDFPLAPVPPTGQTVSPFFEGWFANPDGTYSLSFGYFNRNANSSDPVYLPIGPENFIEPAEFDGFQPEHFPPRRVRGTFTVTVPGEFAESGGRVVWTLVNQGETLSVPGRTGVPAYELDYLPMAMGSLPPLMRFEAEGPSERGLMAVIHDTPLTTSVGEPLTIRVWTEDDSLRDEGRTYPVRLNWFTHQGPAYAVFSDELDPDADAGGEASAVVTFPEPGEYILRVQADVFSAPDSSSGNQCCWSNGFVTVHVAP